MAKVKNDNLGDRMKRYEATTRFILPRRTYTLLRVDGRAFHTWTRGLKRPYDTTLMQCMDTAAIALCEEIAGAQFAYVQSDEISVLATDFADTSTQPWFDGVVQKWVSVAAAIATMSFNGMVAQFNDNYDGLLDERGPDEAAILLKDGLVGQRKAPNATFDARVFTIPDHVEVANYFVWRQQDAERNSVAMLAQNYASAKQLHGKGRAEQHEVIFKAGDNWAKHPVRFKHGAVIRRQAVDYIGLTDGFQGIPQERSNWFVDTDTPKFTAVKSYLDTLIPIPWDGDLVQRLPRKAKGEGA